ncbi:MAG: hypothetical protein IJI45_11190 [Anaerolineaceae bacterium]|nr:hypothetical protein [Anaerolineaceae bacterium]
MADKPVWRWGWTTFDEIRLEKEAKRLCTLADQYEGEIGKVKSSIGDIGQGLNTDAGEKLTTYVSELCTDAEETAKRMRDAASAIRTYNESMLTLWEAFNRKLQQWEAALTGDGDSSGGSW